ncbi:MAG: ATP-binding protein [Bacteroidota bacterium]
MDDLVDWGMNRKLSLSLLLLFTMSQITLGQEYAYQNFNELNGLASSETYEVFQDSKGFVWFATDRGVSRYDGGEFKNFTIRDGLSDNTVFGFYEDHLKRIWFRTYSGALSYYQNDSIHRYKYNVLLIQELGRSLLTKIYYDSLDNMWFSSVMPGKAGWINKDGKISMMDRGEEEHLFLYPVSDEEYLFGYTPRSSKIRTIKIKDTKYKVEISSLITGSPHFSYVIWNSEVLISINRDIFRFYKGILEKVFVSEPGIIGLSVDRDNYLWVGFFDGGVKRFSNNQFKIFTEIPLLQNKSVGNVLMDTEGGHWFSTLDHGVYYVPNTEIELLQWSENTKVSCAASTGNKLFVGNYQGELTALETQSKKVIWSKNFKIPINSLFVDKKENVWVSDITQLQCFSPSGDRIFSLHMIQGAKCYQEDSDGSVWVGNNSGIFKVSGTGVVLSHGIMQKRIFSLFVTDSLTYVGAINGLSTYTSDLLERESPLNNIKSRISVLQQLAPNVLLIGTVGEGLIILSNGALKYCSQYSALGDIVYSIAQVKDYVWIGTEKGVARIRNDALMNENFEMGLLTRACGLISDKNNILISTSNHLWSFSDLGISIIPHDIQTFQNEKPISYLRSVEINNVELNPKVWEFSPDQNNISLEMGVISFNNRKLFYRHRLSEFATWNQSQNRTISYYSLQPNEYHFEMQVSTDNRRWASVPLRSEFEILTPWWKAWYSLIFYVMVFLAIGYAAYNVRIKYWRRKQAYLEVINNHQQELIKSEVEALERDRRRIAKDLHDGVGTALTSVKWIVNDAIHHTPQDMIQTSKNINEHFNEIILEIKRIIYDLNPPALERYGLEVGLKNFIDRVNERKDIRTRFDYFGTGEIAPKVSITIYRIVQELVNNTLKHSKATEIKIHVNQFEDFINIMYEDNGIGIPSEQVNGFGMHSIESRVQTLQGHMSLESSEKGTFYNFDLPFKTIV